MSQNVPKTVRDMSRDKLVDPLLELIYKHQIWDNVPVIE
jgi:hypothetical protein